MSACGGKLSFGNVRRLLALEPRVVALMNSIILEEVTKAYRTVTAVDRLDLQVPAGSLYGFIGPTGSGKTTTLRMILNIIQPDSGRVEVLGRHRLRSANDRMGYLPEERGLYKKMTVLNQLVYYATLKGMKPSAARQAALDWLERLDLSAWGRRKIEALSKGMAQKVQFIAAVLSRPELLILDEPFSGLDPVNLDILRQAILQLQREGTTVIFSTHDMTMAERLCDYVLMIFQGRKVLDGALDDVRAQYGVDTIRLRLQSGREVLDQVDGILHVLDQGQYQDIRYAGDPQKLLERLLRLTRVLHFEVTRPSLNDIFLRIAGPQPAVAPHQQQTASGKETG